MVTSMYAGYPVTTLNRSMSSSLHSLPSSTRRNKTKKSRPKKKFETLPYFHVIGCSLCASMYEDSYGTYMPPCCSSRKADRTSLVEQLGPRLEPEGEAQPTRPEEIRHLNSRRKYQPEEPLYSDYGSDLDEEDDYLKRRGDLSTIDERTAMSEAISAVHLNSATIIKLAIIGAELQNIVKKSVIKVRTLFLFCLSWPLIMAPVLIGGTFRTLQLASFRFTTILRDGECCDYRAEG